VEWLFTTGARPHEEVDLMTMSEELSERWRREVRRRFRTAQELGRWMHSPHPKLGRHTPAHLLGAQQYSLALALVEELPVLP